MNTLNDKLPIDPTGHLNKVPLGEVVSKTSDIKEVLPPSRKQEVVAKEVVVASESVTSADSMMNEVPEPLVNSINSKLSELDNYLRFEKDDVSGRDIYTLIDGDSEEVIKQFPSEEFLKVSRRIIQYLETQLSDNKTGNNDNIGNIINNIA